MLKVVDWPEGRGDCRKDGSARTKPVCPTAEQDRQTAGQAKSLSPVFFSHFLGIFKVSWGPLGTEGHAKLSTLSVPSPLLSDVFGYQACVIGFDSRCG